MNTCFNHSEIEAFSICHGCGKEFCESCLDEGKEYYYCINPGCQELLKRELPSYKVLENATCPQCGNELELSENERIIGKIHCQECDKIIDYTVTPPKISEVENFMELLSSFNQGDIALIKSILEDGAISYNVVGEIFLSVRPLLEPVRFFVADSQVKKAHELLKNFDFNLYGISTKQS